MAAGIYTLINQRNGRCYIGSANRLSTRKAQHLYLLRKNKHHCLPLQNAWNKYGETNFSFEILEYCDVSELLTLEQKYLDSFIGLYNVAKFSNSRLGIKSVKTNYKSYPSLLSPSGEIFPEGDNLKKFCLEHNLTYKVMNQVVLKHKYSHKGWTLADGSREKLKCVRKVALIPDLISPTGERVSNLSNIQKFCRENSLDIRSFHRLLHGKFKQTKGWRLA